MRFLSLAFQIIKLVFIFIVGFVKLNIASLKGRRAFKEILKSEKLPDPVVTELAKEYGSIKRSIFSLLRNAVKQSNRTP